MKMEEIFHFLVSNSMKNSSLDNTQSKNQELNNI